MPIATIIALIGKSYSVLDFQADVIVRVNGGAKVFEKPTQLALHTSLIELKISTIALK